MLPSGFVYEFAFLPEGAVAKQEDHDEGVRETDFCAVDEAVADGFDEHEDVMVFRVEENGVYSFFGFAPEFDVRHIEKWGALERELEDVRVVACVRAVCWSVLILLFF